MEGLLSPALRRGSQNFFLSPIGGKEGMEGRIEGFAELLPFPPTGFFLRSEPLPYLRGKEEERRRGKKR